MAARGEALAACANTGMRATTAVHSRRQLSASGRPARHSRKRTAVCDGQHADELGRCNPRGADSIPIARHRLRGRFSPTGSFAYRTRGGAVSLAINCAPRPPGKRLSALWRALHSDPLPSFETQECRSQSSPSGNARQRATGAHQVQPRPWHRDLAQGRCADLQAQVAIASGRRPRVAWRRWCAAARRAAVASAPGPPAWARWLRRESVRRCPAGAGTRRARC